MIIDSAAAYSLVLLLNAITIVVPSFAVLGSPMHEASNYIEQIIIVVAVKAGMAPTVLVARIATNDNYTVASATITHISGLKFGSQQGNDCSHGEHSTGGDINITIQADDLELTPVIKVKREVSTDATSGDNQV
ncbi:hypothetical protein CVT25_006683 [Psilocybe cyanescens]|uniref:Uncharacterized protein n=1 Tax=Psilocybe cyanescens TaxID=93625 RepID=A0A409XIL4_PSICY|nr:hypothetical protein CVT25_006683 [Psilocybe cyanescens]